MSGGLGFIDIILFAMLAAFLIYRLGSVLGKRTGHEQQRRTCTALLWRKSARGQRDIVAGLHA